MGIFDKFRKKPNPEPTGETDDGLQSFLEELGKLYQAEGLDLDLDKTVISHELQHMPKLRSYGCVDGCGKSGIIFYISSGTSTPPSCPVCGHSCNLLIDPPLTCLLESAQLKSLYLARGHYNKGMRFFQEDRLDECIRSLSRAIELFPDYEDVYHDRSEARIANDDYDGAIADCNQVLRLNPQAADAYINRGSARANKGDFEGAISDSTKAIEIDPSRGVAFMNRGLSLVELGRHAEAIMDLRRFINICPDDPRCGRIRKGIESMPHNP